MRVILCFLMIIILNACSLFAPSVSWADYKLYQTDVYPVLDFTQGKWAIYKVNAPAKIEATLEKEVEKGFGNLLGDRLINARRDDRLLIDRSFETFDEASLKELAKSAVVDYIIFVNVKDGGEISSLENGSWNPDARDWKKEIIYREKDWITIKIYDLRASKLVFNRTCMVSLEKRNASLLQFYPSERKRMIKAYQKLFESMKYDAKY